MYSSISSRYKVVQCSKYFIIKSSFISIIFTNIVFASKSSHIKLLYVLLIFLPSVHSIRLKVIISCFSLEKAPCNVLQARRLKYWSFQPISTSAFTITLSYHCIIGYKNSCNEILTHFLYLLEKLSLSSISATEKFFASSQTVLKLVLSIHSLLYLTSTLSISSIFEN